MERSLHPNLIYDLLDLFLSKSKGINSQLILASHESSLLTQKLLRKDEIWFVVKDNYGASTLHSLEQYNVRFHKEIRKDYLLGRFKATARLGNRNTLTVINKSIIRHSERKRRILQRKLYKLETNSSRFSLPSWVKDFNGSDFPNHKYLEKRRLALTWV